MRRITKSKGSPSVSFIIRHPNQDLSGVLERLGLSADRVWRAGDQETTPKGRVLSGKRAYSCAATRIALADEELEQRLEHICDALRGHRDVLATLLTSGASIEFYITLSCGTGLQFDRDLMTSLADLGIGIGIDAYR